MAQSTSGKCSSQPAATSTPQNIGHQDQLWLQQAYLNVTDAFLNQLDDTPAKGSRNNNQATDKSSKSSKKSKPVQLWFMMPEQKQQHLDILKVSSDQSSDEPLRESSVTSSSDSNSSVKKSRCHRSPKSISLSLGCLQSIHQPLKNHNCGLITIWIPILSSTCPSSRISPGTSWWLGKWP